jgi:membrane protease YdiL (CAAX protease family)
MSEPVCDEQKEPMAQHSLKRTLFLHLFPGALATAAYLVLVPVGERLGLPSFLMLMVAAVLFALSFQIVCLLREGKRTGSGTPLKQVIGFREPLPVWQYAVLTIVLLAWIAVVAAIINPPIESALIDSLFSWVPSVYFFNSFADQITDYSRSMLVVSALLLVLINGLVGPVVEELYFRGYLLPRISRMKGWAPLVNSALFSLYHFFSPWQNPLRILAFTPVFYAVWWRRNIYIGIIIHCLGNLLGSVAVLLVVMKS